MLGPDKESEGVDVSPGETVVGSEAGGCANPGRFAEAHRAAITSVTMREIFSPVAARPIPAPDAMAPSIARLFAHPFSGAKVLIPPIGICDPFN